MKKKILSLLLVLTMLLSSVAMLGITVGAVGTDDGDVTDGEIWGATDFKAMLAEGSGDYRIMVDSIDFENDEHTPGDFSGTIDGDGNENGVACVIERLVIDGGDTLARGGLFANFGGTIANLTLASSCTFNGDTFAAGCHVGGFIGVANGFVTLENLTNYMAVSASTTYSVGGILGTAFKDDSSDVSRFINCKNYGKVENTSTGYAGGIVAISNRNNQICEFDSCENYGEIKSGGYAGGIYGGIAKGKKSTLTNCVNTETVEGVNQVGGLVGYIASGSMMINSSINYGNVSTGDSGKVGGLVGGVVWNTASISLTVNQSASVGDVVGGCPGGIIGQFTRYSNSHLNIDGCYVRGNIKSTKTYSAAGFVGETRTDKSDSTITITNSYVAATLTSINDNALIIGKDIATPKGTYKNNLYDITLGTGTSNLYASVADNNLTQWKNIDTYGDESKFKAVSGFTAMVDAMSDDGNLGEGKAFLEDTLNINGGYPILAWQHPCTPKFAAAQESTSGNGIRFLATVDTANLSEVGFTVVAVYNDGEEKKLDFSKKLYSLYDSIKENEDTVTAGELGGQYIFAHGISGIDFDGVVTFKVRAYTVSFDGTETYTSGIYTVTYNNGTVGQPELVNN